MRILDALRYIKHDILEYYYYIFLNYVIRKTSKKVEVKSIEETLKYVIQNKVSVSRFGDGELLWILGEKQNSFQEQSEELQQRLSEIIKSDLDNHIVCLTGVFGSLKHLNHFAIRFWARFMANYRRAWMKCLKEGKTYYDTNMTRLYMDIKDKKKAKYYFELIKEIWKDRDIVIIEGELTRLGVGNDLFSDAKSIKRILAPNTNAFSVYDSILNEALKVVDKEQIILIALGPTATVLAYDLAKEGYQALDVGHIDIEYEWMKMGATSKIPVASKYVNEAPHNSGKNVGEASDKQYYEQIISRVMSE